jgi:PAS domain S-box-containing protein
VVILALSLLASLYDQRLNVLAALDAGRVGYWEMSLPDRTLEVSPRGRDILGQAAGAPFSRREFTALLPPQELERSRRLLLEAIESGQEYDAEYRLQHPERGAWWVNVRGRVVAWSNGQARRMAGVVLDVTERRQAFAALAEADARQRLLIDELNHRVKNTLATVQSIARQTAKGAAAGPEFVDAFESRLVALSRTHDALTRSAWEQASLQELLGQEFSPYAAEQFRLDGPDVSLRPRQALALGMVFHELATNAAKHGALSRVSGCVEVGWTAGAAGLQIEWREHDGPPVATPQRRGFGSRLITATIQGELCGVAELNFARDGLVCRLRIPLGDPATVARVAS